MGVFEATKASLSLLSPRGRKQLILAVSLQMATGFLDLLGVLLLGSVAALALASVSGTDLPPTVVRIFEAFGQNSQETFALVLGFGLTAAFLLVLKTIVSAYLNRRILRFLAHRQAEISSDLTASLLSKPILQVQSKSSQEVAYALTGGVQLATFGVLGQAAVALSEIALLLILTVGLLIVNPLVTLFSFFYFALIAFALHRIASGIATRLGQEAASAEIASYVSIQDALKTYREILVAGRRGLYARRVGELRLQAAAIQSDVQFLGMTPKYVFEAALVIGGVLLAVSQWMTNSPAGAVATIAVFLAAGSRIVPSILRMQSSIITLKQAAGGAENTYAMAAEVIDIDRGDSGNTILIDQLIESLETGFANFDPTVELNAVSVTYTAAKMPAIDSVSLKIPAGSSLGLIGSTGSGKSTLADLVLGVLSPDMGTVLIGGLAPMRALTKWPGACAYVPQHIALVNGSVRENVALGFPVEKIDDMLVFEALRRAHLSDFLDEHRDGLDTVIGENGVKLSGGQRQRLGIARALFTRPKLLLLDEATSALDAETEMAISTTLQELEGSVTVIAIAHRLATVMHSDQVAFLDQGQLRAVGTFDEVRALVPALANQANLSGLK